MSAFLRGILQAFSAIARTTPSSIASLVCAEFAVNPGRITARQTIIRFLIMSQVSAT